MSLVSFLSSSHECLRYPQVSQVAADTCVYTTELKLLNKDTKILVVFRQFSGIFSCIHLL